MTDFFQQIVVEPFQSLPSLTIMNSMKEKVFSRYGTFIDDVFYGVSYYDVTEHISTYFLNLLPKEFREHCNVKYMEINVPIVPPHRDNGVLFAWNFYLQTNNEKTHFWKPRVSSEFQVFARNGEFHQVENLVECASFQAKSGESWILNVREVHSVSSGKLGNVRSAIVVASETISFHQILQAFFE